MTAALATRSGLRRTWLLAAFGAFLTTSGPWGPSFSMPAGGLTRKQRRGTLHNKDRLPTLYEIPLDQPEPEPAPKDELPERRPPYTLNIVTHFDDSSNPNMKYIEKKVVHALENTENMIRNVAVWVHREGHHHREKPGRSHPRRPVEQPEIDVDDADALATQARALAGRGKGESVTPFLLKVKVDLHNHRSVVLSNAEKHAMPTLTEAVDHTMDVLRKLMREERTREIRVWRKRHVMEKAESRMQDGGLSDGELELLDDAEAIERLADQQAERLYRAIEAAGEQDASAEAAQALEDAVERTAPEPKEAAPKKVENSGPLDGVKSAIAGAHWVWRVASST